MKYCANCNRITAGKPLFCNFCGRSYNVKLCPRLHVNPRNAEACAHCGSRDLSTPQPRVPFWATAVEFLASLVPGLILAVLTIGALAVFSTAVARQPELLASGMLLLVAVGVLWWVWSLIPAWIRKAIYYLLRRRREGDGRKERR